MSTKFTFDDIAQPRRSGQLARLSRNLEILEERRKVETGKIKLSQMNDQISRLTREQQKLLHETPAIRPANAARPKKGR